MLRYVVFNYTDGIKYLVNRRGTKLTDTMSKAHKFRMLPKIAHEIGYGYVTLRKE